LRKRLTKLTILALVTAQVTFTTPAFAQSDEAIEAARRVNIAGRQRMLSQRMSKAACFISSGVNASAHLTMLSDSYNLFAASHEALRVGSEPMGLSPEQNTPINAALGVVQQNWGPYAAIIVEAMASEQVSAEDMPLINSLGLELLGNMNQVVNKTANEYGNSLPDMPLILSITIDLAGRQRMFTQKAAKEFCMIDAGIEVTQNREQLAETTQYFTLTLGALISGMPGVVMAAPNENIRQQLEAVAAAWANPKATLERVAAGEPVTDEMRAIIVNDMETVLTLMNEAVGMYEEAIPEPE